MTTVAPPAVTIFKGGDQEKGKDGVTELCEPVSGQDSKMGAARRSSSNRYLLQGLETEVQHHATFVSSPSPLHGYKQETGGQDPAYATQLVR